MKIKAFISDGKATVSERQAHGEVRFFILGKNNVRKLQKTFAHLYEFEILATPIRVKSKKR